MTRDYEKARDIDDAVDEEQATRIAFRKFVKTLGDVDDHETDIGVVEATYRALDVLDDLREENRELCEELDEVKRNANSALGVAKASDSGARSDGAPGKKDLARFAMRNELVKRVLLDDIGATRSHLTVGEVQTMLRPGTDVAYQTVKDAMNDLVSRWDAFSSGENEGGLRVIRVSRDGLNEEVVGAVEVDLGRDDLTKRLISRRGGEGGR